ncbi:ATP-binding protein [Phenylobacterium sp.]|uniref:hybrid sensor histidine kinase/response regulator n=1 Tax=Phenylobacterium sp. TaxID=1871053 RepID=UPI00273736EC|nr:ATP-binding protein [Phenylobacterium sp.]MDP3854090.1 ATP-binding protein [Phenylobacterium sp.]
MDVARVPDLSSRLADMVRTTSRAVMLCDCEGRIEWVNDGFGQLSGYGLDEVVGRRPAGFLQCPETDPQTIAQMSAALAAGEGFRVEILNRAKSGRTYWIDLDVRPSFDAQGVRIGTTSVQTEITAAYELQGRLHATTVALRQAGALARLGGWEVDLKEGVVRWSPELARLLGRPALVESHIDSLELYDASERERVREHLRVAVRTGERVDFESSAVTGAGERIWLRVIGEPEMLDGVCVALHGASQDVTAQRAATAELAEAERFGRGVIDGMAAMLTVIDESGAIIAANSAFKKLGAEIVHSEVYPMGRNLFAVLAKLPDGHGRAMERGVRAVLDGRQESFVRAYSAQSGEWFRMTAARFAGEGPVRCVVITQSIEDIKRSERRLKVVNARLKRARDEANAANAAKSAFLATMSHEIRTPLNGVLGMAQAMTRDELPEHQRERLTVIRQAGETLLALLNDLLDLSRIEAGRLDLEDGLVDVGALMLGAQATFTTLASEKDVSFTLNVAPDAAGVWRGDPTRVRQVVYNLISNAVKFTGRGEVAVSVAHDVANLVFEVTDTGPGIAADRLGKLFQKFVQEDASTTRRFGGSGLGLAICRELAGLMGGEITVRSKVGEGSVFTVRLPLVRAEGAAPVASAVEAGPAAGIGELKILAAEDNPMNQLVLKTLMAQLGVNVRCVDDGQAAVEASAAEAWDVILMDVQMPVMDGPTATRLIRQRELEQGLRRTPIIALTANAMAHHQVEYLAAGMDVLVPKPLELDRLLSAIQTALDDAA